MLDLGNLTIERFLPLARMQQEAQTAHAAYVNAKPYPHVVFDNFFDP